MDDFYQFMSPLEGATPPTFGAGTPQTTDNTTSSTPEASSSPTASSSDTAAAAASSRSSWSSWGVSFNKLIERGKKDMNEFVEVTRKDLNELAQTVQQERSTAIESITKRVEGIKTTLPPIPASVNTASADILGRMSHVVEGIKQEITEAATGLSSQPTTDNSVTGSERSSEEKESSDPEEDSVAKDAAGEQTTSPSAAIDSKTESTESTPPSATPASSRAEKSAAALAFASTASLLSAGASTLSQTLTSSTKDIGTTANQLFKKTLPAVAEKHLGEADHFLKSTTESLKTNGLLAEQYVNKFGAGMANFLNNAVVISAPEEKEVSSRSKKMLYVLFYVVYCY